MEFIRMYTLYVIGVWPKGEAHNCETGRYMFELYIGRFRTYDLAFLARDNYSHIFHIPF